MQTCAQRISLRRFGRLDEMIRKQTLRSSCVDSIKFEAVYSIRLWPSARMSSCSDGNINSQVKWPPSMRAWNASIGKHEVRARKEVSSAVYHVTATDSVSSIR